MKLLTDLSREAYDAIEAVNFSTLKHLAQSPAKYRYALDNDRPDTDALRRGRVTHLACLEPDRLPSAVVVFEGARRAGKEWDAFEKANAGKEILTLKEFEQVKAISLAVRNSPQVAPYLEDGRGEVSVTWETNGVACKGRMDWLAGCGAIVDLKTTKDASPLGFPREVLNYKTHAQAAFYSDGYAAATGDVLPYLLIAVEPVAPFAVQVYRVPPRVLSLGREMYLSWMATLIECRRENRWPGYGQGELDLVLPAWADPYSNDVEVIP